MAAAGSGAFDRDRAGGVHLPARPVRRMGALRHPGRLRLRHRHRGRPGRSDRRHLVRGRGVRLSGGSHQLRVRLAAVRVHAPLPRRARRPRRHLPVPAHGPRGGRETRIPAHVHAEALVRPGRKRPARQLQPGGRGRRQRLRRPFAGGRTLHPRPAMRRGTHAPPPLDVRAARAHRQLLPAAASGEPRRLLGQLGLRPPRRHGAHPRRAGSGDADRAPAGRRRGQPLRGGGDGAAGRTAGGRERVPAPTGGDR